MLVFAPLNPSDLQGGGFYLWRLRTSAYHGISLVAVQMRTGDEVAQVRESDMEEWRPVDPYETAYNVPWMCTHGEFRGPFPDQAVTERALASR